MQDYWNDPPEEPEIPECCELEMLVDDDGNCKCSACGATIEAQPDIEPPDVIADMTVFGGVVISECSTYAARMQGDKIQVVMTNRDQNDNHQQNFEGIQEFLESFEGIEWVPVTDEGLVNSLRDIEPGIV